MKSLDIVGSKGTLTVYYACPFALLYQAALEAPAFARFMLHCLRGRSHGRVVIYNDGVTPGNNLRPDKGRHYEALYWSLLEFPSWYRSRVGAVGWIGFAYVLSADLKSTGVTVSALLTRTLRVFWGEGANALNFDSVGMRITMGTEAFAFRLRFGCFLADDLAHAAFVSGKGQSGTKPCVECGNCVGRCDEADVVDGLVHITNSNMSLFERHTPETYVEMAETLRAMATDGTDQTVFKRAQQILGLKYNPEALPWDVHLRDAARLPYCIFWDWQHNGVGSGGIGQYELNQFVRHIMRLGITANDLDEFAKSMSFPRGEPKLRANFFETRIVNRDGAHIRAFASEVLTATTIIGRFSDQVLKPQGALRDHVECFDKWRIIIDILRMDQDGMRHLELLDRAMAEHHESFLVLYGDCAKFKPHGFRHVLDSFRRFQVALSCFACERRHRFSKSIASFSYNKMARSILAHDINEFLKCVSLPMTFEGVHLNRPVSPLSGLGPLFAHLGVIVGIECSVSMATPRGTFGKRDLLFITHGDGHSVGFALLFVKVDAQGHLPRFFAYIDKLAAVSPATYSHARSERVLVAEEAIQSVLPYQREGSHVNAVFPTVL
jgi:hypothetical protein